MEIKQETYGELAVRNILLQNAIDRRQRGITNVQFNGIADDVAHLGEAVAFPHEANLFKKVLCPRGGKVKQFGPRVSDPTWNCVECGKQIGSNSNWRCECCDTITNEMGEPKKFVVCVDCKERIEGEYMDVHDFDASKKGASKQRTHKDSKKDLEENRSGEFLDPQVTQLQPEAPIGVPFYSTIDKPAQLKKTHMIEKTEDGVGGGVGGNAHLRKFSLPTRKEIKVFNPSFPSPRQDDNSANTKGSKKQRNRTAKNDQDGDDVHHLLHHLQSVANQNVIPVTREELDNYDISEDISFPTAPVSMTGLEKEAFEREARRKAYRDKLREKKEEQIRQDREEFLSRLHEITAKKQSLPPTHFVNMYNERQKQIEEKNQERLRQKKLEEEMLADIRRQKGASANLALTAKAKKEPKTKEDLNKVKEALQAHASLKLSDEEIARRQADLDRRAEERRERQKLKQIEEERKKAELEAEMNAKREAERIALREKTRKEAMVRIVAVHNAKAEELELKRYEEEQRAAEEFQRKLISAKKGEELRREREEREAQKKAEAQAALEKCRRQARIAQIVKEENEKFEQELKKEALERKRAEWKQDIVQMKENLRERERETTEKDTEEYSRRMKFEEKCRRNREKILESYQTSSQGGSIFDPRPFLFQGKSSSSTKSSPKPRTAPE